MKIPSRYAGVEWKDVPKKVQDHVLKMKEHRRGLYIHGSVGSGKTHLMYAIAKGIEEKEIVKIGVRAYSCTDLLRQIREDFNQKDAYSKEHVFESVLEYRGLLMIDDIGSEKLSEWVLETFYAIVNKRYEEVLPTIFTSNLEIHELAERIGDRTVSRIVESCDGFEVTGEDRRLKKYNKIKAQ